MVVRQSNSNMAPALTAVGTMDTGECGDGCRLGAPLHMPREKAKPGINKDACGQKRGVHRAVYRANRLLISAKSAMAQVRKCATIVLCHDHQLVIGLVCTRNYRLRAEHGREGNLASSSFVEPVVTPIRRVSPQCKARVLRHGPTYQQISSSNTSQNVHRKSFVGSAVVSGHLPRVVVGGWRSLHLSYISTIHIPWFTHKLPLSLCLTKPFHGITRLQFKRSHFIGKLPSGTDKRLDRPTLNLCFTRCT